jgi:hypothetical protein
MAVQFKKFEGNDGSTLNDLGTLKTIAGKGGSIGLIRKNFNDPSKRVAVLVTRKDGQSAVIPCSTQVSNALRSKKMKIAQLIGLSVLENEEGRNFVSMPATGGVQGFEVDKLNVVEMEAAEADFLPEELIAL